jgi:glyoxylase-like metal-dependent hydrolase (beta-lactamase superfamily II)
VERFHVRLWMSRLEYLTCRLMAADTGRKAPVDGTRFYRAAGWDESSIERYQTKFGQFGEAIYPLPASYRRLADGDLLTIGERDWRVVVGNGHSPEHACLYDRESKLFVSGDQVLPKITSNVSVHPTEPDADPLSDWLASLRRIREIVPDDVLVLPAHNSPFLGLHARIDQLLDSHRQGLARLEERLAEPMRAIDTFSALFARPITPGLLGMATGEAVAHLNHLTAAGRAVRDSDAQGVWWWRRARRGAL